LHIDVFGRRFFKHGDLERQHCVVLVVKFAESWSALSLRHRCDLLNERGLAFRLFGSVIQETTRDKRFLLGFLLRW
jgi:hypothetical protein